MLVLLSPAKTLDYDTPLPTRKHSEPRLLDEAGELIEIMRTKSAADVAKLMKISDELAALNVDRYAEWSPQHTRKTGRPAALAFAGDVYQGMDAASFTERDFTEAQKTVRILSGLYGVLRPLDLMQPYRLEMGTKLATDRGDTLVAWWGERITDVLRDDLAESPGEDVVINLASVEYFSAVDEDALGARVISPRFEDRDDSGRPRIVSFHAKKARGLMAAWLVRDRARTPARLKHFAAEGYAYDKARSTPDVPVFVR